MLDCECTHHLDKFSRGVARVAVFDASTIGAGDEANTAVASSARRQRNC